VGNPFVTMLIGKKYMKDDYDDDLYTRLHALVLVLSFNLVGFNVVAGGGHCQSAECW